MLDNAQQAEDDLRLLEGIKQGNQEALTALYDRYSSQILAVAFHITKDRQEAEDLVHDVFIEAWKKFKTYDPRKGSVKNWLLLRARSRAIDRLRKHSRVEVRYNIEEKELSESAATMNKETVDPLEQLDYHHAQKAINNLSPEHRLLVRASYFEDLTYREISEKYNIPEGTVKSRMLAAFKILRKQLFLIYRGDV